MPNKQKQNDQSNNKQQKYRMQTNNEMIKLYISLCQQPIPDIINQCQQTIYSHFKFYFNDSQLMLSCIDQVGDFVSILHRQLFEKQLNQFFHLWKSNNILAKQKQINNQSQNQENRTGSVVYSNFIAFIQYWVMHTPNLYVKYAPYNQIITQCISKFLQNKIYEIAFSLAEPSKPFKLKTNDNKIKKIIQKQSQKVYSLSCPIIEKRLNIYFTHFSKMQNLSSSPIYSSGSKTFDQLVKSYSTVNLQQWICFNKSFTFDKILQQIHKQRGLKSKKEQKQQKKTNTKNYIPVKNVKWNSSLQYFKNLFQKFCDNSKQLNFEAFRNILNALFKQVFSKQALQLIEEYENLTELNQLMRKSQKAEFQQFQLAGIFHLKLHKQQQFKNKLRSFGIFVSQFATVIQNKLNKSYAKVKPKYLNLPTLPLMSSQKIKNGKENKQNINKSIIISNMKDKNKTYTLQQLMAKKQYNQNNKQSKMQTNDGQIKAEAMNVKSKLKKTQYSQTTKGPKKHSVHQNNQQKGVKQVKQNGNKTVRKQQQKSYAKKLEQQYQDEEDQYLNNYYNKNQLSVITNKNQINKIHNSNRLLYDTNINNSKMSYTSLHVNGNGNQQVKHNSNKNSLNIIKRLDDRIQKMQKKLL